MVGGTTMKRRLLALFIAITWLLSVTAVPAQGNIQISVSEVSIGEVYYVAGQDVVTGKPLIKPTMTVQWEDPDSWVNDPDPTLIHTPDFYEIVSNNLTRGTDSTIRINSGSQEFTDHSVFMHEKINLDTGSLYKMEVKPFHYHLNAAGTGYDLAPVSGIAESAYAITDLNVDFETTESSIQVIWDDLGVTDFTYTIVYAIGDYTNKSKQDLLNNKEGEITALTSDSADVEQFYDPVTKRNKLAYTIEENIYPGQVYSVMVEPTVEYYNNKSVMRNRNYPVIRTCSTNVEMSLFEEGDYIRLEWDIPGSFKVGQNKDEYGLVEATLLQYVGGQSSNVVIFDGSSAIIGYYKVPSPTKETQYQIKFVYRAVGDDQSKPEIEPVSNIVTYVPSDLLITPTKPHVPSLFSEEIFNDLKSNHTTEEIRLILSQKYFVPGYTYAGNLNPLLSLNNTYHLLDNNQGINLVWGAFQRIDVDLDSPTYNKYIFDSNVYYDIWVTESLEAMAYGIKAFSDMRYGSGTTGNNISDGSKIYGYSQKLGFYYDETSGELEPIIPGKLYYIKIVAKKKTANGDLISEPTIVSLYYGYDGDAYEPPSITKPPLAVKDSATTDTGITINWEESWWEVISAEAASNEALSSWRHEVWVSPTGVVSGTKVTGSTYFPVYQGQTVIDQFITYLNSVNTGAPKTIQSRLVDLGQDAFGVTDIKYKFKRIPYADVIATIAAKKISDPTYDFTKYYEEMIAADKNGTIPINWSTIVPTGDITSPSKLLYREEGLLPNTSYLFMLYPYREVLNGDLLYAHYPTPIVVSTKPTDVVIVPDPTVPNLYVSNYSDASITLTWKYNLDFTYELVYSEFEDLTKAVPYAWSLPSNPLDPKYPKNGKYFEVIVEDLFPNTEYYFWIRAKEPSKNTLSHWSNAVLGKTRDISNPYPPNGFGIASLENMKLYGYDASVTDNFLAVEWVLDNQDVAQATTLKVKRLYTYVLEVSDNPKFIDPIYIESTGGKDDVAPDSIEFLRKNLVKINELIPNRAYYLRVKTRLTVTGQKASQVITKDSTGYSPTIKIITVSIGDEYDGIIDRDLIVLPSENYEIIYNEYSDILEYRFRDNGASQDGTKDNNVDQRLITNLINQNLYIYEIDVAAYKKEPITKRIISIPYVIMEAFNTYKIDMVIDAGPIKLTIPHGAIVASVSEQVKQYGVAPDVKIQIETLGKTYLVEQMAGQPIRAVASAVNLGISVKSDQLYQTMKYTDQPLGVELLVNNLYEQFRVNRIATVKDVQNKWQKLPSTFNSSTGYMSFDTARVGVYSGYVVDNSTIASDKTHWSLPYRKDVMLDYTIQGLTNYNPNNKVSETKMINVIYPLAQNLNEIDLNAVVTKGIMTDLKYAKIKTNDSSSKTQITREEAISMFVRTYEILHETTIQPTAAALKAVSGDASIGATYKGAMAKAVTVGMISKTNGSRPKEALTYGELFALWSKINN